MTGIVFNIDEDLANVDLSTIKDQFEKFATNIVYKQIENTIGSKKVFNQKAQIQKHRRSCLCFLLGLFYLSYLF